MNSSCPTNYSASYMEIGCSSNINQKSEFLLSATFARNSNGCYEVTAHVPGHLHPYPVGC